MKTFRNKATILVLSIAVIPLLLIVILFAVSLGLIGLAQSQVDGITDATSHAGAVGGAYAYERAGQVHKVILEQPDPSISVLGAIPSANKVWAANMSDKTLLTGLTMQGVQFNPAGMEGKSTTQLYYEAHFWATSQGQDSNIFLPKMAAVNLPMTAQALTQVQIIK